MRAQAGEILFAKVLRIADLDRIAPVRRDRTQEFVQVGEEGPRVAVHAAGKSAELENHHRYLRLVRFERSQKGVLE